MSVAGAELLGDPPAGDRSRAGPLVLGGGTALAALAPSRKLRPAWVVTRTMALGPRGAVSGRSGSSLSPGVRGPGRPSPRPASGPVCSSYSSPSPHGPQGATTASPGLSADVCSGFSFPEAVGLGRAAWPDAGRDCGQRSGDACSSSDAWWSLSPPLSDGKGGAVGVS